jgi:hypothetical protein
LWLVDCIKYFRILYIHQSITNSLKLKGEIVYFNMKKTRLKNQEWSKQTFSSLKVSSTVKQDETKKKKNFLSLKTFSAISLQLNLKTAAALLPPQIQIGRQDVSLTVGGATSSLLRTTTPDSIWSLSPSSSSPLPFPPVHSVRSVSCSRWFGCWMVVMRSGVVMVSVVAP